MKKIQEMSEEEILNHAAGAIHDYLMRIRPYGEFVLETCVQAQVNELKRLYRYSLDLGARETMSRQDMQEMNLTISHFEPRMRERASDVQLHYTKELTLWKLRSTSAEASIAPAFKAAGLPVHVEKQKYRAKVLVNLGGRQLSMYIPYKTLYKEETLPNIIQAVFDLKDAISRLGSDVKISK
jgi:hypothetical protein